jgi:hypothetical protein
MDVGLVSLREHDLDCMEGYECYLCFSNACELGMHVDRCEKVTKKAGYNQRQILDYWDDLLCEPGYCNRCLEFIKVFTGRGFIPALGSYPNNLTVLTIAPRVSPCFFRPWRALLTGAPIAQPCLAPADRLAMCHEALRPADRKERPAPRAWELGIARPIDSIAVAHGPSSRSSAQSPGFDSVGNDAYFDSAPAGKGTMSKPTIFTLRFFAFSDFSPRTRMRRVCLPGESFSDVHWKALNLGSY